MFTRICEPIKVAGVFGETGFQPKKFLWRGKAHLISQITLISKLTDGGVQKKAYSVIVGATLYRLKYTYLDESWLLEEVWCE